MLKRPLLIAAIFGMAVLSAPAFAADADVCYSTPSPDFGNLLTSKTSLHCPIAGTHTLPELARAGWSIVTVSPVVTGMADPSHPATSTQTH